MEHQVVAVGVAEVGDVADARAERLPVKRHTLRLELCAGCGDVGDPEGDVPVLLRLELEAAWGSQMFRQVSPAQNSSERCSS